MIFKLSETRTETYFIEASTPEEAWAKVKTGEHMARDFAQCQKTDFANGKDIEFYALKPKEVRSNG